MNKLKLLLVEDNEQDQKTCMDSIDRYKNQHGREIQIVACVNADEAASLLSKDNTFDGAIIDLRLTNEVQAGNKVAEAIMKSFLRIPSFVFTGTPEAVDTSHRHMGIFKKGEVSYIDIFDKFWEIHSTGLPKIMGGRGLIEEALGRIFRENILTQMPSWIKHGKVDAPATEKALLRQTLSHLLGSLDDDTDLLYPEEAYHYPPLNQELRTGSIILIKGRPMIVLSPSCDLVKRANGKPKTTRVLLAEIDDDGSLIKTTEGIQKGKSSAIRKKIEKCENHNPDSECYKYLLASQEESLCASLSKVYANSHAPYLHWLPQTDFFKGGFVNFRHIQTLAFDDSILQNCAIEIQVAPPFIKDIVARFSTYYARQGQPDLKHPAQI